MDFIFGFWSLGFLVLGHSAVAGRVSGGLCLCNCIISDVVRFVMICEDGRSSFNMIFMECDEHVFNVCGNNVFHIFPVMDLDAMHLVLINFFCYGLCT